jgi:AcrR family transcriptional regulator
LSKSYFYESFADVDALAAAVIEALASRLTVGMINAFEPGPAMDERARRVIRAAVEYVTDEPHPARVLFGEIGTTEASAAFRNQGRRHNPA